MTVETGPGGSGPGTALPRLDATTAPAEPLPLRIVQFGGGNFLRAFVDQMVQRANEAGVTHHGIAIVKATPSRLPAFNTLARQDGRFHVLLRGVRDGTPTEEATLVTAVQQVLHCYDDYERYATLALEPDLRIVVSNTTEAGIVYLAGDDLTATPPASFPAKVTAFLHARWRHFEGDPTKGLLFLPCELIEDNGTTLREYVLRLAADARLEPEFLTWVQESCRFHDTLVDRIVPGFPADEIDQIQKGLGLSDGAVVVGEAYGLWAIGGDTLIAEELPLDRAGMPVRFLPDVRPYREEKVRTLNGAHTAMSALGIPLGCATVLDADRDPDLSVAVRTMLDREVLPTLDGDPAALRAFAASTLERFANPYIQHHLQDIGLNALSKWHARNLPSVRDTWRRGEESPIAVLALAALLLRYIGGDETRGAFVRDDENLVSAVREAAAANRDGWVPKVLARLGWAEELGPQETAALAQRLAAAVAALRASGTRATLRSLLGLA